MTPVIASRAAKLLRLACGSGSPDGEKLAALDRLSALAAAHDLDWDQVLSSNGASLSQEDMQKIFAAGYERGVQDAAASKSSSDDWAPAGKPRANEIGNRLEEIEQLLEAGKQYQNDGLLDDWFAQFTTDMRERVEQWGNRAFITEKQWNAFDRLRTKLTRLGFL